MPSTSELTDISEPSPTDIATAILYEGGDLRCGGGPLGNATTTITGLRSRTGRRRRRTVLHAVAASAALAAVAAIAMGVVHRSERDRGAHSLPAFVEVPPMAEPWVNAGSAGAVPAFVEAPPMAEPDAAR